MMGLPAEFSTGVPLVFLKINPFTHFCGWRYLNCESFLSFDMTLVKRVCKQFIDSINNYYWNIKKILYGKNDTKTNK
jgi:hypothetical protein